LQSSWLHGRILLNLDTEDDTELTIGCAGGVDVTGTLALSATPTPTNHVARTISLRGLTGGHSGMDIHLGRGNANKLMNRLLWQLHNQFDILIHSIDGGSLRNAIPRESTAIITCQRDDVNDIQTWLLSETQVLQGEYAVTDPDLTISFVESELPETVVFREHQERILQATYAIHHGIFRMSPNVPGLVQTSNNLARVHLANNSITWACLTRSSVDSERDDLARMIRATLELAGAQVELAGEYPGWQPAPQSAIVDLMSRV
jgi:dipeptidase D